MTDYITRIDEKIRLTSEPEKRLGFIATKACYLARMGEVDSACEIVTHLRREFRDRGLPSVLAWAMLVEGLLSYFTSLGHMARDRVQRSHESGRALGAGDLSLLSASWLAHLDFEQFRYSEMARQLNYISSAGLPIGSDTALRVGLVLGDAHLYTGNRQLSRSWYNFAHENALRAGDQAAVGALMYNRAVFGLSRARVEWALDRSAKISQLVELSAIELASAKAFERAIRVSALPHLIPLNEARIMILREDYGDALIALDQVLSLVQLTENRPNRSQVLGDIAYCCAKTGDVDRALCLANEILRTDQSNVDYDDRVVVLAQLSDVLPNCSDSAFRDELERQFSSAVRAYIINTEELVSALTFVESQCHELRACVG